MSSTDDSAKRSPLHGLRPTKVVSSHRHGNGALVEELSSGAVRWTFPDVPDSPRVVISRANSRIQASYRGRARLLPLKPQEDVTPSLEPNGTTLVFKYGDGRLRRLDMGTRSVEPSSDDPAEASAFMLFLQRLHSASNTDTASSLYTWAESHGFSKQSMYNMISQSRVPGLDTLRRFRKATGKSIDWLLGEDVLNPTHEASDGSTPATTASNLSDEFVLIPRYDVKASAGTGHWLGNDAKAPFCMAFRRHWVENYLHAKEEDLSVVRVHGDSMAPILQDGDNILVNHAINRPQDGIYVIRIDGQILVKQTQVLTGKKLRIVSVNTTYESYTVDLSDDSQTDFGIIGKVVWFGRQI